MNEWAGEWLKGRDGWKRVKWMGLNRWIEIRKVN